MNHIQLDKFEEDLVEIAYLLAWQLRETLQNLGLTESELMADQIMADLRPDFKPGYIENLANSLEPYKKAKS